MARSAVMYKDSPRLERGEDGKHSVKRGEEKKAAPAAPDKEEKVADGTDGMPVETRHMHERRAMHHKHMGEHMGLHHKHEMEHSHGGEKAGMHERHETERAALHKEHHKELSALHDKHEGEMGGESEEK